MNRIGIDTIYQFNKVHTVSIKIGEGTICEIAYDYVPFDTIRGTPSLIIRWRRYDWWKK